MSGKRVLLGAVLLGVAGLAALWLLYAWGGHALVTAVFDGRAPAALARVVSVRSDMPIEYNLARADNVFFTSYRILAGLWTLLVAAWLLAEGLLPRPRVRAPHRLPAVGIVLLLLGPTPAVKTLGLLIALLGPAVAPAEAPRTITISTPRMRLSLASVMALAFLAAPYWSTVHALGGQLAGLALIVVAVLAWAWASAGSVSWNAPSSMQWRDAAWIALALSIVNLRALAIDVPWMGDEDYHIMQIVHLCETAVPVWVLTVGLIVWIAAAGRLERAADGRLLAAVVLAVAIVGGSAHPHLDGSVLRYPYLTRWAQGLLVQGLFPLGTWFYQEPFFRMVPFLSACALAIVVAAQLTALPRLLRLAFAVVVATVPTLLYYTSTLALEMPALVMMTAVGFAAAPLLRANADEVRSQPAWLALLSIGMIKESIVAFLAAFAGCRLLGTWRRWRSPRAWLDEARLLAALILPLAIYIVYRRLGSVFREYGGSWHNAFDASLWFTFGESIWEQLGPLAILAFLGLAAGWRQRDGGAPVLLALAAIAAGALFFVVDEAQYVGFSRYNLVIVPSIVCAATWGFAWLAARARLVAGLVVALLAAANVWLSPLHADGTKIPGWGGSAGNVAEQYYPYRDAMRWLHDAHRDNRIFFAGLGYPYFLEFQFRRLDWHPAGYVSSEALAPADARHAAAAAKCDLVVYPVPQEMADSALSADGVSPVRLFHNLAHRIAVFEVGVPEGAKP